MKLKEVPFEFIRGVAFAVLSHRLNYAKISEAASNFHDATKVLAENGSADYVWHHTVLPAFNIGDDPFTVVHPSLSRIWNIILQFIDQN